MLDAIKPGYYEDLSNDDYHADPAISRSHLMRMKKTPFHYWHEYINPAFVKPKPADALIFGSALHTYVLEFQKFYAEYFILPNLDLRKKADRELKEKLIAENPGKQPISEEQLYKLCTMRDAIYRTPDAIKLISGKIENSLFWQDEYTGLMCKVRPDIWHTNMIVDLKSSADLSKHAFMMSAYSYGYHIQAAMMQVAFHQILQLDIRDFIFLACEKEAPFAVSIDIMTPEFLELGYKEFRHYLELLADCKSKDNWPGYGVRELAAPHFTKFGVIENE